MKSLFRFLYCKDTESPNLHFVMIFARVVQIAIIATGFYM